MVIKGKWGTWRIEQCNGMVGEMCAQQDETAWVGGMGGKVKGRGYRGALLQFR